MSNNNKGSDYLAYAEKMLVLCEKLGLKKGDEPFDCAEDIKEICLTIRKNELTNKKIYGTEPKMFYDYVYAELGASHE
ncbi:TPA: hypothetical protein NEV79_000986 [Acinetobacter baumannii]|uniref:hypothetical protein n=1 Tax=Acinetobacter baumannii TaxID=470 RepID=UPI002742153E|nr:hypothetical protein [Acinetobacter baumannii]MDP7927871.1 hypothetical protein [Acinetobacter baumannii]HCD9551676.1 hypothetical protein [Acinetobacter baumannii]HCD9566553.1 hypothetical protein [Acinetobacter baumannii]HCD9568551.1 hypothetical protein [Acinetobacter baumannii]HCD9608971.1 hypothetical protein [Acinetobacter baumannii]